MKYNVKAILDFANIKGQVRGDEFKTNCPFHTKRGFGEDKNPSFSINLEKGIYGCWSCKASGNIVKLVIELGLTEPENIFEFLEPFVIFDSGQSGSEGLSNRIKEILDKKEDEKPKLENYNKIYHPYFRKRKIHKKTVIKYRAGYNKRLKRIIFPIYNINKKVVGLVGRSINNTNPPYLFSKNAPLKEILFGIQNFVLPDNKEVILVEGTLDQVWLYQLGYKNCLSPMMTQFYDSQIELLSFLGVKKVILFFDNDRPGKYFTKFVVGHLIKRFKVFVITNYFNCKDAQAMSKKQVDNALRSQKLYIHIYKGGEPF